MTAREAIQAVVDGSIEGIKYSPVDRIKAIILLDEMERREADGSNDGSSLVEALERSAAALSQLSGEAGYDDLPGGYRGVPPVSSALAPADQDCDFYEE